MATPLNGTVIKAFEVLGLFEDSRREINAAIAEAELGMNIATAHRMLMTLEEVGALISYRRGSYCLGPAMQALGRLAEVSDPLAVSCASHIRRLASELGESVMVSRLASGGPTCIAVAASSRPISVNITVGTVLPIGGSAQGKLWLSRMTEAERHKWLAGIAGPSIEELSSIRSRGYARNQGGIEADIGAVAVLISDREGTMIATLSIFGMLNRFDDVLVARAVPMLTRTAARIAEDLRSPASCPHNSTSFAR